MPKLGVNIDHIATLRQARKGIYPSPLQAALICEKAGADSIVAHLREDRRHIQENDLLLLKKNIKTYLNLEMSAAEDIVRFACRLKPRQATLVPEKRKELTTEGGLDVAANFRRISGVCKKLLKKGIKVSLFIDPDRKQVEAAAAAGAQIIEIHTGCFAQAKDASARKKRLREIRRACDYGLKAGLLVSAGHGLDYDNVSSIVAIKEIRELNIGYSIICRALFVGLEKAVCEMKGLLVCLSARA